MAKRATPPDQERDMNSELNGPIQTARTVDLKALLSSAPLEGIDLRREQGRGRAVDFDVNLHGNTFRIRKERGSSSSPGE
jgi:hypothetical protein